MDASLNYHYLGKNLTISVQTSKYRLVDLKYHCMLQINKNITNVKSIDITQEGYLKRCCKKREAE